MSVSLSNSFCFKAAKIPPRRYGHKFSGQKFKPRYGSPKRRRYPKPKWMK